MVKKGRKIAKWIVVFAVLAIGVLFAIPSHAQTVTEAYCAKMEARLVAPLKPIHWYHNIAFSDECSFQFRVSKNDAGIALTIEKHRTEKDVRASVKAQLESNKTANMIDQRTDYKVTSYPKSEFWDEAYFFVDYGPMSLRKGSTVVQIFCGRKDWCIEIELAARIKGLSDVPER